MLFKFLTVNQIIDFNSLYVLQYGSDQNVKWGLSGVCKTLEMSRLQPLRPPVRIIGPGASLSGKLVVTCQFTGGSTVQYALVSSTCKTTRRNMTLAVELLL